MTFKYIVNAVGGTGVYRVVVSGDSSDGFLYELCELAEDDGKFLIRNRIVKAFSLKKLRNELEQMLLATNAPLMIEPPPFLEEVPKRSVLYKE